MSRVGKKPIALPAGVEASIADSEITIKGPKGTLKFVFLAHVTVSIEDGTVLLGFDDTDATAKMNAGTTRARIKNMVEGVSQGYKRKLVLFGVGYRAAVQGKKLSLSLGFSHPVEYELPEGISIETPSQTEIIVSGADKKEVGQVASELKSFRSPDAYKGKGVRDDGQKLKLKETKKK